MAVVIETTLGDITVDLYTKERPRACLNFLKLCKIKYYNYNLFHTINRDFIAQTGDPTGSRNGGESIFGVLEGPLKRYFTAETQPRIRHTTTGLISFVGAEENMIGSQFFLTLAPDLTYLDSRHCVFGEVAEGLDVLELLNEVICDTDNRPYQDVRITHVVILDDPYPDLPKLRIPSRSPSPTPERLQGGRIAPDEEIDETVGKDVEEIEELRAEREAKARAAILEMVGDIPDAEMAPPENVLFVCKLNPVTTDDDLEIIFSRFGKIKSCEVIRDRKTADSLQYAFIEFYDQKACEDAYFKMDNVLIDDRRIHVDFSQSVAKVKWLGKGRGVAHFDDKGRRTENKKDNIGQGNYKRIDVKNKNYKDRKRSRSRSPETERTKERSKSPRRSFKEPRESWRHQDNPRSYNRSQKHNSPHRERRSDRYLESRQEKRSGSRKYQHEERNRSDYHSHQSKSDKSHRDESEKRHRKDDASKHRHKNKSRKKSTDSDNASGDNGADNSSKSKKRRCKKKKRDSSDSDS